jgi:hypothetical protein
MLCIVLMCQLYSVFYYCCSTYFVVVRLLFVFCSPIVRLLFSFNSFVQFNLHYSLFMRIIFYSDPGLYSRYFDPVVQEVPVTITSYASQ